MKAANLVKDCFPDPPTPTRRAWPRSILMMRWILVRWSSASLKSTRFILVLFSLYSSRISCKKNGEHRWCGSKCLMHQRCIEYTWCQHLEKSLAGIVILNVLVDSGLRLSEGCSVISKQDGFSYCRLQIRSEMLLYKGFNVSLNLETANTVTNTNR